MKNDFDCNGKCPKVRTINVLLPYILRACMIFLEFCMSCHFWGIGSGCDKPGIKVQHFGIILESLKPCLVESYS